MTAIGIIVAAVAGVALALPYLGYARRTRDPRRLFATGLAIAALAYVVFALTRGTTRDVAIEAGGVLLFGSIARAARRGAPWLLALAWAAHVAWDVLLHSMTASTYAPWWYPAACIGFDLAVAAAILLGDRNPTAA